MNYLIKGIRGIGFLILYVMMFFAFLFTSVQIVAYNDPYFEWHYKTHNIEVTTGMSVESLMEVTDKMMDYLIDKRDTLDMTAIVNGEEEEVFGEREKAHMVDVKDLFMGGKMIRDISVLVLILAITASAIWTKALLKAWLKNIWIFFLIAIGIAGIIGALFASNFTKYFIMFHEIFFSNDLWILNPKTDILINMVPEIFFFQTAMLILFLFLFMIGVTIFISRIVYKRLLKA